MLRKWIPVLVALGLLAAVVPAGAGIQVTGQQGATAATVSVSITGNGAGSMTANPNPVNCAVGDLITWSVSASAYVTTSTEVKAQIVIKANQPVPAGVVAGPSPPGTLSGGLTIPSLKQGSVIRYSVQFLDGTNTVVRTVDPDIVVTPGIGRVGMVLLFTILAGLGAATLIRRREAVQEV